MASASYAFWRKALREGELPVLELPTDRPRPKQMSPERAVAEGPPLGELLSDPVAAVALWALVLCRHSSQDEVIVGVVGGALDGGVHAAASLGSTPVPVLLEVPRGTSWGPLLTHTASRLQAAREHPVPETGLLAAQLTKLEQDPSRASIFQAAVCLDGSDPATWCNNCDVVLVAGGRAVGCQLQYNPALFDADSAHRLLEHTQVLAGSLLLDDTGSQAADKLDVWRVPMASPAEQAAVLKFNDEHDACPLADEACLHDMVEAQAGRTPDMPAVACGAVELTYSQLMRRVRRLAAVLQATGVAQGSIVGLLLNRTEDIIIAELATMRAGGAFLPIDPTWPAERIAYIINDASCAHVLLHKTSTPRPLHTGLDLVTVVMEKGGALLVGRNGPSVSAATSLTSTSTGAGGVEQKGGDGGDDSGGGGVAAGLCSMISGGLPSRIQAPRDVGEEEDPEPAVLATPRSLCYVIYTSGTTGTPKGTLLEHRSVHSHVVTMAKLMDGPTHMKRFAFNLPYFFDASIFEQYIPLSCGGCSVVCENVFSMPDDITTFSNVASALATIPRLPSMVKHVVQGGEAMTEAVLQNVCVDALCPGQAPPAVINCYGPTECAIGATCGWVEKTCTGTIGRPIPNVRCYVVEPELLVPQPIGVTGELLVGGIQVGRGYLNRPDLTAAKFIECPWDPSLGRLYRTGDLVRWLATGELMFLGRTDFQVKLRGKRIELKELENALSAPGRDVVVLLRKDFDDNEPRLVAYASPGWGDLDEVLRKARDELPDYMVPSAMVAVPTWPFTAGGKLDRRRLPPPSAEDLKAVRVAAHAGLDVDEVKLAEDREVVAPTSDMQRVVVEVMAKVLHIDPATISVFDNFFDLGGTSLSSAKVVRELEQGKHAGNITVTDLMKHPTPSGLATCIEGTNERAHVERRMSMRSRARNLATKTGQRRRTSLFGSLGPNFGSSTGSSMFLSRARLGGSGVQPTGTTLGQIPEEKRRSWTALIAQDAVSPVLTFCRTFCGLCFLQLPYCVAISITIWGILASVNVAFNVPGRANNGTINEENNGPDGNISVSTNRTNSPAKTWAVSPSSAFGQVVLIVLGTSAGALCAYVTLVVLLKRILGTSTLHSRDHKKFHAMTSGTMWRLWFSRNICRQMEQFFSTSLWHETFVVVWLARAMGAKVGRGAMISSCSGLFSEAERIKVGDNVVIEDGARICASAFVPDGVVLTNTVVGDGCVVGVKGMVEAGAKVKPGVVIQPRRTSIGAVTGRAFLRSFPKPNTLVYVPVVVWTVLAHVLALAPLGCAAYFVGDSLSQSGSLPSWERHERFPWAMMWVIIAVAAPSAACLPLCCLLYFVLLMALKKLIGTPPPGPLLDTCGERSRWLLMNVLHDSPLLVLLWGMPHSWQRSLLRCSGSHVGRGAFVWLEYLRYDSHLTSFGDGAAVGGDLMLWCCVPSNDKGGVTFDEPPKAPVASGFAMKSISLGQCAAATHGAVIAGGRSVGASGVVGDYTVVERADVADGASLIGAPAVKTGQLDAAAIELAARGIVTPSFLSDLCDSCVWWFIGVASSLVGISVRAACMLASTSMMAAGWPVSFARILATGAFIAVVGDLLVKPLVALLVLAAAKRTVLRLPEGLMPFYCWGFRKWLFSNVLFANFAPWLDDYYGTEVMCVLFRACGATVGRGVRLFSAGGPAGQGYVRNELEHLVIEDNVVVDTECLIQGHTIEDGGMTFKQTMLGANSILSSRTNILPGAQVGRNCILLEGTLVPPHADVGERGIVAGCPFQIVVRQDDAEFMETTSLLEPPMLQQGLDVEHTDVEHTDVEHIVVGAGVSGVLAAKELKARGKSFVVLDKATQVGGIWASVANKTSHVAISEPSYRFDFEEDSPSMQDFTPTSEVKDELQRCAERWGLLEHIRFGANVVAVNRVGDVWKVEYEQEGESHILHARGIFLGVGAQQEPRRLTFQGEERFCGTISYGIRDDIKLSAYNGARVCIVGGGAFAIENLRTALLNGAKKVTILCRNKFQCWPRAVHYRATRGDATWGELRCIYDAAVAWAGLTGKVDAFMSPTSTTQPSASDFFFLAFKEGRVDLFLDEVMDMRSHDVVTRKGKEIPCDVLLKCVGWQKVQLTEVYGGFRRRNFCFLDGHASLVTCSDSVYSHPNDPTFNIALMKDSLAPGSASVAYLAMAIIRLQLFCMEHPEQFDVAIRQTLDSPDSTCSWMQERLHYEGLPEIQAVVDEVTALFQGRIMKKFPQVEDFLHMCKTKFEKDAAAFLDHPVEYIFD